MKKLLKLILNLLRPIPVAFGLALITCAYSARAGSELDQREARYLKESTSLAESILAKAATGATGAESARISRMLVKIRSGVVVTNLVENDGLCAQEGYGGYVQASNGRPAGTNIFLCKKAMRSLSYNAAEGAQIVLHELAHLDGAVNECDATFAAMNASAEAGLRPAINGYFSKCWPNGLRLGSASGESIKLSASGEPTDQAGYLEAGRREPAFMPGSLVLLGRAIKKSPAGYSGHSVCARREEMLDAR